MAYAVPVLERVEAPRAAGRARRCAAATWRSIAAGTGPGRGAAPQRRRPLHSVAVRSRPRRLGGAHRARDRAAARPDRALRPRRSRARRVGPRPAEPPPRHAHGPLCRRRSTTRAPDAPARFRRPALERRCAGCVEALGHVRRRVRRRSRQPGAARRCATGGVFIGGGIAPKILPALTDGRFMRAFRDKAPLDAMLAHMPVKSS